MDYKLVPMDRSHIPQIAQLERQCFSAPWSEEALVQALYQDNASFIVAEGVDGTVLGYAGLQAVLDEGYIDNVAVRPEYRRQGVAGALLGAFERFAQAHLAFLTLEVRASNVPAIALYERHGFVRAGLRKNYYTAPREDAVIMTRWFREETP